MGWTGAFLPEQYGGIDCGFVRAGSHICRPVAGRLWPAPLFSSIVLAASGILLGGNETRSLHCCRVLPVGTYWYLSPTRRVRITIPYGVSTTVKPQGNGFLLNGCKVSVLDGHIADQFIVVARTSGDSTEHHGLSLFLVNSASPGVEVERRAMVDSRNMAEVRLQDVKVSQVDLLGELNQGSGLLTEVLDRGTIALAAEMLGGVQAAFERTLDYLQQREQFGEVIGSFQALQHRAAKMFCEIELSKSVVLKALQAIDDNDDNISLFASQAKVQLAETYRLVSSWRSLLISEP